MIELADDLKNYFKAPYFSAVMKLAGVSHREVAHRKTIEVELGSERYFVKQHFGTTLSELLKNWLLGRHAIVDARNEWQAAKKLTAAGVKTLSVVGYGRKGLNPLRRQSFLITKAINYKANLEELCKHWAEQPPTQAFKRKLIRQVAQMVGQMHQQGINHRDCYLCHFLWCDHADDLTIIDLHRAQIRKKTPKRWRIKDLAGLYFSAMHLGLTQEDLHYFIENYSGKLTTVLSHAERKFWRQVQKKAEKLERKHQCPGKWLRQLDHHSPALEQLNVNGQHVSVGEVLRLLPKKRLVAKATWERQPVAIKLFFDKRQGQRHFRRELAQWKVLNNKQLPVAPLLHASDNQIGLLIFNWLQPMQETKSLLLKDNVALRTLVKLMVKLNKAQLRQKDFHLDNFLFVSPSECYLMDVSQIKSCYTRYNKILVQDLAKLILHLAVPGEFSQWAKRIVGLLPKDQIVSTEQLLSAANRQLKRWYKLRTKKLFRSCSEVQVLKQKGSWGFIKRRRLSLGLHDVLHDIDAYMDIDRLKSGNTCTVAKVVTIDPAIVIKRYNLKHFFHAVKRSLQCSRAKKCWLYGHRLQWLGIRTPQPIAMLEKRWGPLRRQSYLITEYIEGESLQDCLASLDAKERLAFRKQAESLVAQLHQQKITHGDLKASNFLVDKAKQLWLIDLDAMRQHRFAWCFKRAARKDQQRLANNDW